MLTVRTILMRSPQFLVNAGRRSDAGTGSLHICSDSKVILNMLAFLNKQTTNPSVWKQHMDLLDKKGENYLLRCKYCRLEFRGSSSRAKAHLVGKGKGVRFCTAIPPMVRANLLEEINPTKTIDETDACSSKKKKQS